MRFINTARCVVAAVVVALGLLVLPKPARNACLADLARINREHDREAAAQRFAALHG